MSFRGAHAWLRGYSDALRRTGRISGLWDGFEDQYNAGYTAGLRRAA